jgi:hypothetical protein
MMNRFKFLGFALTGLVIAMMPKTAEGNCPATADKQSTVLPCAGCGLVDTCRCCHPPVPPDKTGDRQVRSDLTSTFNAKIWAEEFKRLFPDSDEELMYTWFANAIMCGYDHAQRQDLEPVA